MAKVAAKQTIKRALKKAVANFKSIKKTVAKRGGKGAS